MSVPMSEAMPVPPLVPDPGLEPAALRRAFGRFATGVTIITCRDAQAVRVGLTANSFASLSLDPPLVLWSLRRHSPSLPAFEAAGHFAINVLAEGQLELSRRFASPAVDRFAEGQWADGYASVPVLGGCAAVFECVREARHDAGDHVLFIGRVLAAREAPLAPLLYQGGHYRMMGEVL